MSEFDVHVGSSKLYGWNGTREREIGIDPTTRALMSISYPHAETHGQNGYLAVHSELADSAEFIDALFCLLCTVQLSYLFFEFV